MCQLVSTRGLRTHFVSIKYCREMCRKLWVNQSFNFAMKMKWCKTIYVNTHGGNYLSGKWVFGSILLVWHLKSFKIGTIYMLNFMKLNIRNMFQKMFLNSKFIFYKYLNPFELITSRPERTIFNQYVTSNQIRLAKLRRIPV